MNSDTINQTGYISIGQLAAYLGWSPDIISILADAEAKIQAKA